MELRSDGESDAESGSGSKGRGVGSFTDSYCLLRGPVDSRVASEIFPLYLSVESREIRP